MTTKPTKKTTEPLPLANHQIVVVAAFLAGAQSDSADTEDIAVKANELYPGRFSWRKYKDQINIETVRKRLWDATKPEKGAYLIGSEKSGWRLTKAGFDFACRYIRRNSVAQPTKTRASQVERAAQTREVRRMINEDAFTKFRDGGAAAVERSDAERFFRVDDYVTGKSRAAKIERFRIMASGQKDLLAAIDVLARIVMEGGRWNHKKS